VALARAIINDPGVIFADEPTGNLDSKTGEGIIELLLSLVRDRGMTLVVVTHDAALATRGDRRLEIRDGQLA
jgi:predicted ABC-type transport system involved in lysophospholipase L1 biosynthesis ATPase subunit